MGIFPVTEVKKEKNVAVSTPCKALGGVLFTRVRASAQLQ